MIETQSRLGTLVIALCFAAACSQKDPEADNTDPNDTSDETSDTSNANTTTSSSSATTDVGADTTETSGAPETSSNSDTDTTASVDGGATSDDTDTNVSDTTSDTSTDDTTSDGVPLKDQLCPMAVGATWTYKHSDWTEVQTVTATEYDGESAFMIKDTPDPGDNLRGNSVHVKRDGRLLRVFKEELYVSPDTSVESLESSATYGVGFLRCDEAWATKDAGWQETPEYIRIETKVGKSPKAPEERRHTFTIEGREDRTTSNGKTYRNCVVVRRTKDWAEQATGEEAQEKRFWFCPGVGKVREENVATEKFEELVEYSLPQ